MRERMRDFSSCGEYELGKKSMGRWGKWEERGERKKKKINEMKKIKIK